MCAKGPVKSSNKSPKEKFDGIYKYAKTNPRDVIAYLLLVVGIILLFFQPVYGGIIIGIVAGIYFGEEIISVIKGYDDFVEEQGLVRSLILLGILLAFFISAPAIFIGAALVVCLKFFLAGDKG